MANTVAQQEALIEKLQNVPHIERLQKASLVKELGQLTFTQRVFDELKCVIDMCWWDEYLPNMNVPALTAFDVLATKMHLKVVRNFMAEYAEQTAGMKSFAAGYNKAISILLVHSFATSK